MPAGKILNLTYYAQTDKQTDRILSFQQNGTDLGSASNHQTGDTTKPIDVTEQIDDTHHNNEQNKLITLTTTMSKETQKSSGCRSVTQAAAHCESHSHGTTATEFQKEKEKWWIALRSLFQVMHAMSMATQHTGRASTLFPHVAQFRLEEEVCVPEIFETVCKSTTGIRTYSIHLHICAQLRFL
mmetsp:Transcript_1187/g.1342  ORF Transcript_1187/g.1342 Transcript_1187/m.1342 type:complete len:184 (-) Transcript_1187:122-673(-)